MRYELTDNEWAAVKPMLPNKPRGVPPVNERRIPQRHLLGLAIRRTSAQSARRLRRLYQLLQSLRSLVAGWRLEPNHEGSGQCT
jgi:hypothetical protein